MQREGCVARGEAGKGTNVARFCWTAGWYAVLSAIVRSHAFDFNAASQALKKQLLDAGVDFSAEDVDPKALREAFARLDRRRAASKGPTAAAATMCQPARARSGRDAQSAVTRQRQQLRKGGEEIILNVKTQMNRPPQGDKLKVDCVVDTSISSANTATKGRGSSAAHERNRNAAVDTASSNQPESMSAATQYKSTRETRCGKELSCTWSFDAFVQEQKEREQAHETQKARTFDRVLTALGGRAVEQVAKELDDLPEDIVRAWDTRNDDKTLAEARAAEGQRKREEDRQLSRQRERLRRRHCPDGEDSVGDDPLAESAVKLFTFSEHPVDTVHLLTEMSSPGVAGNVQLELGMSEEALDKLLSELEEESGVVITNERSSSELSQVLDVLNKAAGDDLSVRLLPRSRNSNDGNSAGVALRGGSVAPPS